VPYSAYRPDFTDVMDGLGRATFDALLVDVIVPLAGDLRARLEEGIDVADIGCGTGHTTNLLARGFPNSRFVGYDIAVDAIDRARAEAAEYGLGNVRFDVQDVAQLPAEESLGAVFAFDAIHDQTDPDTVLARVHEALVPGGIFAMFDIRASSHLENNLDYPMAPMLYGISTLHCMTISLAEGGAGLGTVWGQELALKMLGDAGFVETAVHEVPHDPLDSLYVAHKRRN
jgi:SAM-dependent methyltransferase